ncbi:MAG: hypothetical protein WDZ80_04210 [Candidatus Paceibacterota bacterium]
MRYHLYHDESKVDGYWHGIYLLPEHSKRLILDKIKYIRENNNFDGVVSFKNVKRKNRIFHLKSSFLQLGIASLIQTNKAFSHPIYFGKRVNGKKQYEQFGVKIGAKFILFREKDDHKKMSNFLDYGGKVETTFRMGLKGGIHMLGSEKNEINIEKFHFDGHKQYGRRVDSDRIINRLNGLRKYCKISNGENLIDDRSSNHTKKFCQSYDDCQLLQLTDVLVGSLRYQLSSEKKLVYEELTRPVTSLTSRYFSGPKRMANSRWRDSFSMSECYLEDNLWKFQAVEIKSEQQKNELTLFD